MLDSFSDFGSSDGNPSVSRPRRTVAETGSFGKSTRRSRSRTGTPAAKREDPTLVAADAIFSNFLTTRANTAPEPQRNPSLPSSTSQPNLSASGALTSADGNAGTTTRYVHKEPTEVVLRGFKDTHQYAAIREYERIGGRICEDYPRHPPLEQRRYKSDLRDQATLRTHAMTIEEKAKAMRFAGGEHWIKVTFDSAEGAEAAVDASPQKVLGHLVYAELYRGVPPTSDEAIIVEPSNSSAQTVGIFASQHGLFGPPRQSHTLPRSFTTPAKDQTERDPSATSPTHSNTSSATIETGTLSAGTTASGTVIGQPTSQSAVQPTPQAQMSQVFCHRIPTAKRVKLLPAEEALLPQKSSWQRVMAQIPFLSWFSGEVIGSQVPRKETGEFDWERASMYWRAVYWLDMCTGWFDLVASEKED